MSRVLHQPKILQVLSRLTFVPRPLSAERAGNLHSRGHSRQATGAEQTPMVIDPTPAHTSFRCGAAGLAYNEAAFRHFLGIERRKAMQGPQTLLLVLVSIRPGQQATPDIGSTLAAAIFNALGAIVRETDVVGWYRDGRVAAAMMTLPANAPEDARVRVAARVNTAFATRALVRLPLRIRLVALGGHAMRAGSC